MIINNLIESCSRKQTLKNSKETSMKHGIDKGKVVPIHAMKACSVIGCIPPFIHNLGSRWT